MTGTGKSPDKGPKLPAPEDGKKALFGSIKNSSDPHVRRYATFFLGQLEGEEEITYLASLLRDSDKGVREQAMAALARSGQPGFAIISGLVTDPEWKVRYRACEALGLMRDINAVPLLIRALDDVKDHVRYMAAKSLGLIGDRRAEQPLIGRINDENKFVRKIVAGSLGKLGGNASVEALQKQLDTEQSDEVKKAISHSISQLQE